MLYFTISRFALAHPSLWVPNNQERIEANDAGGERQPTRIAGSAAWAQLIALLTTWRWISPPTHCPANLCRWKTTSSGTSRPFSACTADGFNREDEPLYRKDFVADNTHVTIWTGSGRTVAP
jgi:hypothetical protein